MDGQIDRQMDYIDQIDQIDYIDYIDQIDYIDYIDQIDYRLDMYVYIYIQIVYSDIGIVLWI